MRFIPRLICLSVLFQFLYITAYPANHYVDKNANGLNNGSSWTNAWKSFSAINWSSVQPGDVVYISGGTDSTVYNERLVIGKSGSPGNYITVRNSYEAGHNGRVVIEDPNTNSFDGCIYMTAKDYIYIKGLETRYGIRSLYLWTRCDYVTIDSCIFKNWYPNGITGGVKIEGNDNFPDALNCSNIEIKNCTVVSLPLYNLNSTDAVYGQGVFKLRIHDNFIHQRNKSTNNMHVDCIQLYRTADVKIWNNVCIVDSGVTGHGMILGVESRADQIDTMIVYNNYIYAGGHLLPGGDPYINAGYCRWYGFNYHPLSYWIHNTLVTANGGESPLVMEYMAFFKNNIIVQYGTNGVNPNVYGGTSLAAVTSANPAWCTNCNPPCYVNNSTNNLFWREWGDISFTGQFNGNGITGTPSGWSGWSNTYGGTGINANPLFVNNVRQIYGYIISSNSPAINQGSNLKAFIEDKDLPWTDILGNPRDSSPDIGAYQYTGSDTTFQLVVNITDGRNLVSVPGINPSGMGTTDWWPNLTGPVYKLVPGSGYVEVTSTTPSVGYWIKNTGTTTYYYPELVRVAHNPIPCASGWNMIGGYELSVNAANITTIPPGLRSGPIFKYTGEYKIATKIDPGYGYWIKLTGAGQIILPETVAEEQEPKEWFPENWGRIIMTDAAGTSYTLYSVKGEVKLDDYELPPIPPVGMFDIRFSSGRIAEDLNSSIKEINLCGVIYPLTVRVEGMDMKLMGESGRINVNLKSGEDVVISDATVMKLIVSGELVPSIYALEQNYPNPFNPNTVIEYSLPEASFVSLTIYNTLGQKVTELVNGRLEAGHYNYQWNASNVATGMYIYELKTDKFVSVKKMILLR